MQTIPGFSIVTPSFNQAEFIERTLQSVLSQQGDFSVEHLVMDGGSTDGTLEILEKYASNVRSVSEPDQGMADALNKGFAIASGEIIGWLNSDDTYLPGTLHKVANYFNLHQECRWLYGNCRIIDDKDHEIRKWITAYKNRKARKFTYENLLLENFISQPAVFMRRETLEAAGPIDPGLPTAMDYDLWLRLAKLGKPGYIDDDLASFRVHHQSISSRNYKNQFEEQYQIHRRYDQNRWRLMKHRVKNRLIVFIYGILGASRSSSRPGR
jgi:glycosyltransferase involved in cell wall biosynthesis